MTWRATCARAPSKGIDALLYLPTTAGGRVLLTLIDESFHPAYDLVGRCRLKSFETRVASAWLQRLKLKNDNLLSDCAFNCNMRRYYLGVAAMTAPLKPVLLTPVERCRLTL